jgi:hypothetical protein
VSPTSLERRAHKESFDKSPHSVFMTLMSSRYVCRFRREEGLHQGCQLIVYLAGTQYSCKRRNKRKRNGM